MGKKKKKFGRTVSPYKFGGFWTGYNRLLVGERKKFISYFLSELGLIDIQSFFRLRKNGTKSPSQKRDIERIFAEFGVTGNIFDDVEKK